MKRILIAVALALAVTACSTTRIRNVENQPISLRAQQNNVGAAIERTLSRRGWTVQARREGAVDAYLTGRDYRADITVTYTQTTYSILNRGSEGLDQRGRRIHENYNRWIETLNRDLARALS
jgi:hypothetical protein